MLSGPMMHEWEGICAVETTELRFDRGRGMLFMQALAQLYEAEQHVAAFGPASDPVCWTLTGYAAAGRPGSWGRP